MEKEKLGPDHYRYVDDIGPEGVTIRCEKWLVCGETPQCWYVIPEAKNYLVSNSFYAEALKNTRKRILKYAGGKKFCYPTRDEAFKSYRIRKHWQLRHTEHAFQRAKTALAEINRIDTPPALPHICEGGDYFKQMNWSEY